MPSRDRLYLRATFVLFAVLAGACAASDQASSAPVADAPPADVASRVGDVDFANSGSASAQASFHLGLAQLHNFEYDSAAAAFQEAQRIDPAFAMAYWGEAMTKNHPIWMEQDLEAARAVLTKLGPTLEARLAKAPTEREKDYVRAVETLYGEGDKLARDLAYADAMALVHQTYPDDADAAAFHALALLGTAHNGRDFAIYMRAAAIVEDVFRRYPTHPGAVHYLIHSYDDPVHAPLGLRAARAYAPLAPAAPHAQHMTSHIFVALGMWDDVVRANEHAMTVQNELLAAEQRSETFCGHYPQWLVYGYLQQGRPDAARELMGRCRDQALSQDAAAGVPAAPLRSFAAMRTRYLLDTEEWSGEVAAWEVNAGEDQALAFDLAYIDAYRAVRTDNLPEARTALRRLQRARQAMEAAAKGEPGQRAALGRAQILDQQIQAMVLAGGNGTRAVTLLRQAVDTEMSLPFEYGPPFVDKPSSELLGEVLLTLEQPAQARAAFEAALQRTPGRRSTLAGLERASSQP